LGELPEEPANVATTNLRANIIDVETVDQSTAQQRQANAPEGGPLSPNLFLASSFFLFSAPWDWRGVGGAVTSVKNQGSCGSCYAFAVVGVTESMHMISRGSYFPDLSEQQIVDCSTENSGCGGGWRDKAMNYIKNNGLVSEFSYPYTGAKGSCKQSSGTWKVNSVTLHSGCAALRQAVRKGPIAVGVAASSWSFYGSGIYQCPSTGSVNHAVMLVGYTSVRDWIIKNSWGTTWGDKGYMTIDGTTGKDCQICVRAGVGAVVN
jgi:C1A family cysteine protease